MTRALAAALVLALGLAAWPARGEAQAWIRDPGDTYVQLTYRFLRADHFFGADGNRTPSALFRQNALGFYGEVGLVDRWLELVLTGDLVRRNELPGQGAVTGLGDWVVGAYTGLVEDPFRLSFGVEVGVPLGDSQPSAGPNANPFAELVARSLPTGDGETDVTFKLALGQSVQPQGSSLDLFGQAVAGYAVRTNGFTDQVVFRVEGGLRITEPGWDRFQLIAHVDGRILLGDAAVNAGVAGVGDGVSYVSLSPELVARIVDGLAGSFAFSAPVYGTNLPAGWEVRAGLSYALDASEL
ncbi:MAG: hypothetical protein ACFCGT_16550 [Sandaracinaceae bacterium]